MRFITLVPLFLSIVNGYALEPKIIDGGATSAKPWMVALVHPSYMCGGVLYTKILILSAAHCVLRNHTEWSAYVNRFNLNLEFEVGGSIHKILRFVKHPKYSNHHFDISAWWMSSDSDDRTVVVLDDGSGSNDKTKLLTVIGWGKTGRRAPDALDEDGGSSNILLETQLPLNDQEKCIRKYPQIFDPTTMICTGYDQSGAATCQGDSGGPVFRTNGDQIILIGIVSIGEGCGYQDFYSLDVRVSNPSVINFIKKYRELFNLENLENVILEDPKQAKDVLVSEPNTSESNTQLDSSNNIESEIEQNQLIANEQDTNPSHTDNRISNIRESTPKDREEFLRKKNERKPGSRFLSMSQRRIGSTPFTQSYTEEEYTDFNGITYQRINNGPWRQITGTPFSFSNYRVPPYQYNAEDFHNLFQTPNPVQSFPLSNFQFYPSQFDPFPTNSGFFTGGQPMTGSTSTFHRSFSSSGSHSMSGHSFGTLFP